MADDWANTGPLAATTLANICQQRRQRKEETVSDQRKQTTESADTVQTATMAVGAENGAKNGSRSRQLI